MPKLVTKFKYLKPNARQSRGGYAKYIATREGVEKLDDSQKFASATKKQSQLIAKILRDFPDSREMLEYEDYLQNQTVGAASEFITRAIEDNADRCLASKTYADYIATRPRAERFGSHGLFTDDGVQVNLEKVSADLNSYGGNVYTIIISLRREDAERLGFDSGSRWRDMLRTQTQVLAENLKIPMEHLKWFAAFHNESHHPHIHLLAYSNLENEGYLTKKGVHNLRSEFARDIFAQDVHCVYEQQTEYRDQLREQSKEKISALVEQINSGLIVDTQLKQMLVELAQRLRKHKGKKVYGYLSAGTKKLVDSIVDQLAQNSRIAELYDLWYRQRDEIFMTYSSTPSEQLPLSQNPEFKPVRNAVVRAALVIAPEKIQVSDQDDSPLEDSVDWENREDIQEEPVNSGFGSGRKKSWWTEEYKQARKFLYGSADCPPDFAGDRALLLGEAAKGNGLAMYDLGLMEQKGLGCVEDDEQAQDWFRKALTAFLTEESRSEKPGYWQYRIGKMYAMGYGAGQDHSKAAGWYEKAADEKNPFAAYALGCLYRRGQGVEQDDQRAFALFTDAASHEEKPNAYAAYELGRMCREGIGTEIDLTAADRWYRQAYNGFLSIAQTLPDDRIYYRLGQMNLTGTGTVADPHKAAEYFMKAAKLGNTDAQYALGRLFYLGQGVPRNLRQALFYLEKAIEKENQPAIYLAGKIYLTEDSVKDIGKALQYLEVATSQENANAEYLLGKLYLRGKEVPKDLVRAIAYLNAAVAHGNEYAQYLLDSLHRTPEPQSWSVTSSALALMRQTASIFQDRFRDMDNQYAHHADRKLMSKIVEKKLAQGQKLGG